MRFSVVSDETVGARNGTLPNFPSAHCSAEKVVQEIAAITPSRPPNRGNDKYQ